MKFGYVITRVLGKFKMDLNIVYHVLAWNEYNNFVKEKKCGSNYS